MPATARASSPGLVHRLVGELECSPMRGGHYKTAGALCRRQLGDRLHAIFRIHMDRAHEPPGLVGPDRQNRHIERSTAPRDDPEFGMKGGVTSKKQCLVRGT